MRGEVLTARQDRQMELAERAHDLWGRILDAQIAYLNEHSPPLRKQDGSGMLNKPIFEYLDDKISYAPDQPIEMDLNEKTVALSGKSVELHAPYNELSGQASMARTLFNLALEKADVISEARGSLTDTPRHSNARKQRSAKTSHNRHVPKQYTATRLSDEAIADYTQELIDEMRFKVRGPSEPDEIAEVNAARIMAQKRQFRASRTVIQVQHEGRELKKEARNHHIMSQDETEQVLIWVAQAGGPRQAPYRTEGDDRIEFALNMINMGRLGENGDQEMDDAAFWDRMSEAIDQGWLIDAQSPQITGAGFHRIREVLESDTKTDKNRQIFKPAGKV